MAVARDAGRRGVGLRVGRADDERIHRGRGSVRFNAEKMHVESESSSGDRIKHPALEAALFDVERKLGSERELEMDLRRVQWRGGSARKCSIAERQDSVPLNRYWDSLPFDYNRVVLHRHEESDTGYINASHLLSPEEEKLDWNFVIAQGPLSVTVCDFWEMIYKTDTRLIIMLTNLVETDPKGEQKLMCSAYWPDKLNTTTVYAPIHVTMVQEEYIGNDIVKRAFRLWTTYDERERPLVQYQYKGWNEDSVNKNTGPLRKLLNIALGSGCIPKAAKQPILVHCDSAITRSALFVFIATALRRLQEVGRDDREEAKAAVNIYTNLLAFRRLRSNAVPKLQLLKIYCKVLQEEIQAMLRRD